MDVEKEEGAIELHTENCLENGCPCLNIDKPYFYTIKYIFDYRYKKYVAYLNPCMGHTNLYGGPKRIPHKDILDTCIRKIKTELGIKFDESEYQVDFGSGTRIQYDYHYDKLNLEADDVIEVVQEGGFSRSYFVVHKIHDLNLGEILSPKERPWCRMSWANICYLSERLPQTKELEKKIDRINKMFDVD